MTGMSRAGNTCLRVVGGNSTLLPMNRSAQDRMWPRLRVVKPDDVLLVVASHKALPIREAKRPARALMWLIGLVVASAQGIGETIAPYW